MADVRQLGNGPFPAQRILLGVSGSIAIVAVAPGILWMRRVLGIRDIRVVMTAQAASMIPPSTFAAVSGNPVMVEWADSTDGGVPHVAAGQWPDVIVVMPATANILAKAAQGIADDVLSTCLVAASCPVGFAPGMNPVMWRKPATQRNVAQLVADGHFVVPPAIGEAISDGSLNEAAMADVPTVMSHVARRLARQDRVAAVAADRARHALRSPAGDRAGPAAGTTAATAATAATEHANGAG